MDEKWLKWAKQLQALSQAGLEYSKDRFDIERFEEIRKISVEIMSEYTELDTKKVRCLFAGESGYQTPKIDVRAAVFKDNAILLVKEKSDDKWSMPGGWADIDLTLKENLVKEAKEEAGAEIRVRRIIAVLDRNRAVNDPYPYSVYKFFVECEYVSGRYQDNSETSDCRFFSLSQLPELSHTRNTYEQVKMCFEAYQKDVHEVIFD
jgi:ADP-ribose pyrophosphatase YjhB (NUDIX family)